jgi:hypothetical protein
MEFVINVSRVALAIDCDVGAYRRANVVEQSHPADAHSGILKFITTVTRYYLGSFTQKKSLSLCLP